MVVPPRAILVTADLLQERALVRAGEWVIGVTTMKVWGKLRCWGTGVTIIGGEDNVKLGSLGAYEMGSVMTSKMRSQSCGTKSLSWLTYDIFPGGKQLPIRATHGARHTARLLAGSFS